MFQAGDIVEIRPTSAFSRKWTGTKAKVLIPPYTENAGYHKAYLEVLADFRPDGSPRSYGFYWAPEELVLISTATMEANKNITLEREYFLQLVDDAFKAGYKEGQKGDYLGQLSEKFLQEKGLI